MSRRPALFTQASLTRVLRTVKDISPDCIIEITPEGTIRILPPGSRATPYAPADAGPVEL